MCGEEKPLSHFALHKNGLKGRQSRCRVCKSAIDKQHYIKNREKIIAHVIQYAKDRPDWASARRSRYKKNNPEVSNAYRSHRRASKLNATPHWLSEEQRELIKWYYGVAKSLTSLTGDKYEVDHIHPLCGNGFTGLHAPGNLRVLLASENHAKSNRLMA